MSEQETLRQTYAEVVTIAARAKRASRALARQSSAVKDEALRQIAAALIAHTPEILAANAIDMAQAEQSGRDAAFLDRLRLDAGRIEQMAAQLHEVIALPDPVGRTDEVWVRPNGLRVGRQRIPLGTIGIIYEARPNVTSDAAALCLKSGNAVVLKGGSDAFASNTAIIAAMRAGLEASPLPAEAHDAVGFVPYTDRDAVRALLSLSESLDVVIPRGGHALIQFVHAHSRVPVIKHDEGVCHVVIDGSARAEDVDAIVLNAKVQRPGVCNAAETLLALEDAAHTHLPRVLAKLAEAGVLLHVCPRAREAALAGGVDPARLIDADDAAYAREFLSLEIAARVVEDLDAAIAHIDQFSSNHTECLVTQTWAHAQRFQREVDSSVILINASTRFSDGNQLGLGAEIGISTTRMHAYGPMGLEALTTTKFVVTGDGQIRT